MFFKKLYDVTGLNYYINMAIHIWSLFAAFSPYILYFVCTLIRLWCISNTFKILIFLYCFPIFFELDEFK